VELDALALLGERAAISGFTRRGDRSCGGATRLLSARDGWVAVTLARQDDVDGVPAWLERPVDGDVWELVRAEVATRTVDTLTERARLLGLPVGGLGRDAPPVVDSTVERGEPRRISDAVVVDFSSLWAGPLCGHLLQRAGAHVIKVESTQRPDGARRGPAAFFELLNGGKESVAYDFHDSALHKLVAEADIVIEASRPRALQQFGIVPSDNQVWISITAYGRRSDGVGFGDDAAVAGGLVVADGAGPCFCVDAVADPLGGLVATDLALAALRHGRRGIIDVPLAGVAASFAGPTLAVPPDVVAVPPRARSST
jgi:hypothetical protein